MAKSKTVTEPKIARGVLFSLLAIPVGVAVWLFLWQYGFIASVVAWGIAWAAVWLYNFGAGREVTRPAAPYIIGVILLGVVLAFLSGMISDVWQAYTTTLGGKEGFFSEDFFGTVVSNLTYWEFVSSYGMDLLISVAFAALGAGGVIYGLYKKDPSDSDKKSA